MPQELNTTNTALTGNKVKPKDDVTVYGTGSSKFMEAGKPYTVHSSLAAKLIADGKATKEKPEGGQDEGGKGGKSRKTKDAGDDQKGGQDEGGN